MFNDPFYKPSPIQPPGYVFSTAWAIIYPLIAVSGLFIFKEQPELFILWVIQLILNLTWTPGLFIMKNLWLSLLHLIILICIVALVFYYANSKIKAFWAPYLIWLIFALIIFIDTIAYNNN